MASQTTIAARDYTAARDYAQSEINKAVRDEQITPRGMTVEIVGLAAYRYLPVNPIDVNGLVWSLCHAETNADGLLVATYCCL